MAMASLDAAPSEPRSLWLLLTLAGATAILVAIAGLALSAYIVLRRGDLAANEPLFLRRVALMGRGYRMLVLAAYAFILFGLGWSSLAVRAVGPDGWAVHGLMVAVAPFLVLLLIAWMAVYGADRSLKAALLEQVGGPVVTQHRTLPRYLEFMVRQYLLVILVPLLALVTFNDVLVRYVGVPGEDLAATAALLGSILAAAVLAAPWVRVCWRDPGAPRRRPARPPAGRGRAGRRPRRQCPGVAHGPFGGQRLHDRNRGAAAVHPDYGRAASVDDAAGTGGRLRPRGGPRPVPPHAVVSAGVCRRRLRGPARRNACERRRAGLADLGGGRPGGGRLRRRPAFAGHCGHGAGVHRIRFRLSVAAVRTGGRPVCSPGDDVPGVLLAARRRSIGDRAHGRGRPGGPRSNFGRRGRPGGRGLLCAPRGHVLRGACGGSRGSTGRPRRGAGGGTSAWPAGARCSRRFWPILRPSGARNAESAP